MNIDFTAVYDSYTNVGLKGTPRSSNHNNRPSPTVTVVIGHDKVGLP